MRHLGDKIRVIFIPWLLMSVLCIAGYTFLNWLLIIRLHLLSLPDNVVNLVLPLVLPWIPVLVWLLPRTRIVALKDGSDKPRFAVQTVAAIAMYFPMCVAQEYIVTATGRLTPLDDVAGIAQQAPTRYYTLKHYFVYKDGAGGHSSAAVSGKNGQDLNYYFELVLPIVRSATDTARAACTEWLGISYDTTIRSSLSGAEKDSCWNAFMQHVERSFEGHDFQAFTYLQRAGNDRAYRMFRKALEKSPKYQGGNITILLPVQQPFEARNGNKLSQIIISYGIGAAVVLLVLMIVGTDEDELQKRLAGNPTKVTSVRDFFMYFVPHKNFFITPIIVDINIVVFGSMVLRGLGFEHFSAADLAAWGANYRPYVVQGQWWRLVSSVFLHDGIMHIFYNMAGLMIIGILTERVLGRTKYAVVYLLSGITGGLASIWWHDHTVSVGASGAIFGLFGAFTALILTHKYPQKFSKGLLSLAAVFVGINLVLGIAGNVDNAAHIGGLAGGALIGFILSPSIAAETEEAFEEMEEEQETDAAKRQGD